MTGREEDNAFRGMTFALAGMVAVGVVVGLAVLGGVVIANADEQPFTVTAEGVSLPAGQTFPDGGHVNIQSTVPHNDLHFEAKCIDRVDAECATLHDAAQYIGQSFIPWSAFGLTEGCVSWVQVAGINKHFGDAEEAPICIGGTPSSTPTPVETEPANPSPTPTTTTGPSPSPTPSETSIPTSTPEASSNPNPTSGPTGANTDGPMTITPSTKVTPVVSSAPDRLANTGADVTFGLVIFAVIVLATGGTVLWGRRKGLERFGSQS